MSQGPTIILIIGGFLILFPLLWIAILKIIARFGGWQSLANIYRAQKPASGDQFNFASARFGRFTNYSNCLSVKVSPAGVHLHPFILFRVGHSAIFIPWDEVLQMTRWQAWLVSSVQMTINRPMGQRPIEITLYGRKLVTSLYEHAPHHLTDG